MQINWSLMLNVLLLLGVVFMIGRLIKARRQNISSGSYKPSMNTTTEHSFDDIIAVRQVGLSTQGGPRISSEEVIIKTNTVQQDSMDRDTQEQAVEHDKSLMIFLLAKDKQQFIGYELLQTLLAAGLRFGEGQLFHRHQHINGQGPVICSLAAATSSGTFDLQNIGGFSVRGLCLFMHISGNSSIDKERFSIMYATAQQLSEDLNAHLLDEKRQPLSEKNLSYYKKRLGMEDHALMI